MPTEPQINQAIVNAIAERLNVLRKQPCPECGGVRIFEEHDGDLVERYPCHACNVTGTITEPRYQAAWEMVTVFRAKAWHPDYQAEIADGAVRGLLEQAIEKIGSLELEAAIMLTIWPAVKEQMPRDLQLQTVELQRPFRWPKDAQSLGKAFLEALNE